MFLLYFLYFFGKIISFSLFSQQVILYKYSGLFMFLHISLDFFQIIGIMYK